MGYKVRKCGFSRIFPRTTRRACLNNEPNCFRNPRKREFRDIFVGEGSWRLVLCPAFDSRHSLGRRGRATFRRASRRPLGELVLGGPGRHFRARLPARSCEGDAEWLVGTRSVARPLPPNGERRHRGGKAPSVVLGDADIEVIVQGRRGARLPNAGHGCRLPCAEPGAGCSRIPCRPHSIGGHFGHR